MNFAEKGSFWIWDEAKCGLENQYVCFKKQFDAEREENLILYICADTRYAVWLNGELAEFGEYLSQPEEKFYDEISLKDYLQNGTNTLCIEVNYSGVKSFTYKKGTPGLIYFMESEKRTITPDETYVCDGTGYIYGKMPLVSLQIGPSIEYDANRETEWKTKGVDAKPAVRCEASKNLPDNLLPRPVKKLKRNNCVEGCLITQGKFIYDKGETVSEKMQYAYMAYDENENIIKNNSIEPANNKGGVYLIFDMGSETSGNIEFDVDCSKNTKIDISVGEHLEDMRVRSYVSGRNFGFRYTAKNGKNKFLNVFRRTAGRYIQVNISDFDYFNINYIGLRKAEYPVERINEIHTDDVLVKEIDNICINTLLNCMHEHYEDCPWREQALYAMDSRVQSQCGYYVFGEYAFAKASIDLLMKTLKDDGYLDITAPNDFDLTIPTFTLEWIIWATEYLMQSNDFETAVVYDEAFEKILSKHFERFENGLLKNLEGDRYWHFYDWSPYLDGVKEVEGVPTQDFYMEFDCAVNITLYYALTKVAEVREKLLKKETKQLRAFLKQFAESINKAFYDVKEGRYRLFKEEEEKVYTELVQAIAILCDIAPNGEKLSEDIINSNDMIKVTLNRTIYKYEALLKNGKNWEYVMNDIKTTWGAMLKNGATSFYETIEGAKAFDRGGSLCHGWSAVPAYIFRKYFEI